MFFRASFTFDSKETASHKTLEISTEQNNLMERIVYQINGYEQAKTFDEKAFGFFFVTILIKQD